MANTLLLGSSPLLSAWEGETPTTPLFAGTFLAHDQHSSSPV
jgi:hypothetical protein